MNKIVYLLLYLLPSTTMSAQVNLDSIAQKCDVYKGTNSDSLNRYARIGVYFAEKEKNETKLTAFYRYMGIACFQKQNYDTASVYLDKALELAMKQKNKNEEANALLAKGYMFGTKSDAKSSIEYLLKALPVFESLNNGEKTIETLVGVGSAYRRTGNQEMAIKYLNRARNLIGESTNAFLNALTCFELGAVEPDTKKVIEYELKAVEYARTANNKELENLGNQALAYTYLSDEVKDNDKALIHAKECYRLACEQGTKYSIYSALTMMANIYSKQENYKDCETVALQAWAMDSTSLAEGRTLALNIAIANINLKNEEKATVFLKKYEELTDEYTEESFHKEMVEMEAKYETEKKEIRIASLEKERRLYVWFGIAGVLLVCSLIIVLWQTVRSARREKMLIATRSALDGEMRERARLAQDLHDRLSGSLSAVKIELGNYADSLQTVRDKLDHCITDLRETAHNLMPASLNAGLKTALEDFAARFPNVRFHFFGEEKPIGERIVFVMYCCAGELVNNAVKHSQAQNIDVQLVQGDDYIALTVEDDGCGFNEKSVTDGMGLKNIRDRVASCGGKLDIVSSPGKGTETTIEIKTKS